MCKIILWNNVVEKEFQKNEFLKRWGPKITLANK